MISLSTLIPYVLACFLFSTVPGPSVTVVIGNSLSRGTKAGLLTILGTELAMFTMVLTVAIGLEAVMIVWMGWTVYDMVRNPGGMTEAGACTEAGTSCLYDVADRLPGALFYVVMVLFGLFSMIDTGLRHRREIFQRAEPVSQSVP